MEPEVKTRTLLKGFKNPSNSEERRVQQFLEELQSKGVTTINPFILNDIYRYWINVLVD